MLRKQARGTGYQNLVSRIMADHKNYSEEMKLSAEKSFLVEAKWGC